MIDLETVLRKLVGKTIEEVIKSPSSDSGLLITFTDQTILEYGYSDCFGLTWFNQLLVKELA